MATTVKLRRPLQRALRSGHPWLYRDALAPFSAVPGTVVTVLDKNGRPLATGLAEAGPIAVRVFSTEAKVRTPSELFEQRINQALALRTRIVPPDTDAYRLIHGEGDRLPGLVCDRYGDFAVVKLDGEAIAAHQDTLRGLLEPALAKIGITGALLRRTGRTGPGEHKTVQFFGSMPPETVSVVECGMTLLVDLYNGQKTGLFLDHREYRSQVRRLASGLKVLNLYGYTGGFSVAAGLGGASEVTTVDVAKGAIALAQRTFVENGLAASAHQALVADVPKFLETMCTAGTSYDLVVADPPNFAPSERSLPAALQSYEKLHAACMRLVGDGGYYLAGSCSSHVRMADFMDSLRTGAQRARKVVRVLCQGGAPADHPRLLSFPEGDYLKVVLCLVERV